MPELRRKKRRTARLVSPLSFAERQFRLSILRQRENYTWKRRKEASQKKGLNAERSSSCVTAPVAFGNAICHPCGDFRLRPRHVFTAQADLFREGFPADEVINGRPGQATQMHHFGQADKALLNGIRNRHQRRGRGRCVFS